MVWVHLKVYMHLGGSFATDPTLSYVGGKVMERDLDPDMLCYYTLCDMVKEASYRGVKYFSYCEPGLSFDEGLKIFYDDSSVIAMINHLRNLGSLHIYVEHVVDIPIVAEDMTLVPIIKDATHDINTGEGTTNEQAWVDGVSNEVSTDLETSLDTEDFLGVAFEDDEIRDILAKAKKKKKNLAPEELHAKDEPTFEDQKGQRKKLGMVFHGPEEFKEALAKYAIAKWFDIICKRNELERTRAWCKQEGCPFRIYDALDKADGLYKIKTFKETHECSITFKNTRASYKYVGKHFLSKLRVLPKLKLTEMQKLGKEELKVDLSRGTCSRARRWALEEINGRVLYEFTRLFDYAYALRQANPTANIELMVERPTPFEIPKFRRFYVGFTALRDGFKKCCRTFLCLDGCFLKGKGEILTAIGRDGNDQIYPIAWAVVEVENRETWSWFLRNIISDLQLGDGDGFTLMTDQQKGLKEEIVELLPRVEDRVCARHLYANWRKENPGGDLKKEFWAACKSTTNADFEHHISKIEQLKATAKESLMKTDPKQWSKSCFSTRSDCDATDNNFAEAFNFAIVGARTWDLTGIPCAHAIAAIPWKKDDVNDYVYRGKCPEDPREIEKERKVKQSVGQNCLEGEGR
ncbi:hypothetical protein V6N13_012902 [Hibiscus sabdariffa]